MKKPLFENVGGNQFKLRNESVPSQGNNEAMIQKFLKEKWVLCPYCRGNRSEQCELCSDAPYYFNQIGKQLGLKNGMIPSSVADHIEAKARKREKENPQMKTCPICNGYKSVDRNDPHAGPGLKCTYCQGTGNIKV